MKGQISQNIFRFMPPKVQINKKKSKKKIDFLFAFPFSRLLYWYLNYREPFLWVFLVPYSIDVACAVLTYRLIALFVDVAECLDERLVEPFVGADVLHAKSLGHSGQTFELDDGTVLAHLLYLFAI